MMTFRFLRFAVGVLCLSSGVGMAQSPPRPLIMIDPGHGGSAMVGTLAERSNSSANNAVSPGGLKEKDLTLEFSRILRDELLREANRSGPPLAVGLTRDRDVNVSFIDRAAACNFPETACVVSIHFNAGAGGGATGSLALISDRKRNRNYDLDYAFGKGLAAACNAGVRQFIPEAKSRGVITDGHLHGGLGSNFFFQLARQKALGKVPRCFLEIEFIDNPRVEEAVLKGDREAKFRAIAKPIVAYLLKYVEPGAGRR